MAVKCDRCGGKAITLIRYSGAHLCAPHFQEFLERRVKQEIRRQLHLDGTPTRIAVAISGGKDSSTTLHLLHRFLGRRRDVSLEAITVDEGIEGYRPPGLQAAAALCSRLGVPHHTTSYREAVGFDMDAIATADPRTIPCTYCGVFRRRCLNLKAREISADYLATGHNLDDTVQTILMNLGRGDVEKLARMGPHRTVQPGLVPRLQPLRPIPDKEVFLYAHLQGLPFDHGTCPHAEGALRQRYRRMVNELEASSPGTRHAILSTYDALRPLLESAYPPAELRPCGQCGEPTVGEVCQGCLFVGRLKGMA
jgi:uncharacterized protein (TIGR00269 family)